MNRAELLLPQNRRAFIESCFWIPDRSGTKVRFKFNRAQADYWDKRTRLDLIPKARQHGFTTLCMAEDLTECLIVPNTQALFVAQSDEDVKAIGERFEMMYEWMDSEIECSDGVLSTKTPLASAQYHRIALENKSAIVIRTANSPRVGRGLTFHRVHGTECAQWDEDTMRMFVAACLGVSGNMKRFRMRLESTGNGATGPFYDMCMAALNGSIPWKLHFYGWNLKDEYQEPVGEPLAYTDEEKRLVKLYDLTEPQLRWRRQKIEEFTVLGNPELFYQEYPITVHEAFQVRGTVVFPPALVELVRRGTIPPKEVEWGDALRIWQEAIPGRSYVLIADTSSGLADDPQAAIVIDGKSGVVVARTMAWWEPKVFAERVVTLCQRYNNAVAVVERNTGYGDNIIRTIVDDLGYGNIYYDENGRAGWHTSESTKERGLGELLQALRSGKLTVLDEEIPRQMDRFVRQAHRLGAKGRKDHDDLVMCLLIGAAVLAWSPYIVAGMSTKVWRYA